jgi:hypothetical protein
MVDTTHKQRPALKGVLVRQFRGWVVERGLLDRTRSKLPSEFADALDSDVFVTDWIDFRVMGAIIYGLESVTSPQTVFDAMRAVSRTGTVPRIQPILDGIVRLFGLSPAALFSRMNLINRATTRGIETAWSPRGEREGVISMTFDGPVDPPSPWGLYSSAALNAWAGTAQTVFDVCDVRGTVTPSPAKERVVELRAQW